MLLICVAVALRPLAFPATSSATSAMAALTVAVVVVVWGVWVVWVVGVGVGVGLGGVGLGGVGVGRGVGLGVGRGVGLGVGRGGGGGHALFSSVRRGLWPSGGADHGSTEGYAHVSILSPWSCTLFTLFRKSVFELLRMQCRWTRCCLSQ